MPPKQQKHKNIITIKIPWNYNMSVKIHNRVSAATEHS